MLIARESQLIFAIAPLPMLIPAFAFFNYLQARKLLGFWSQPEAWFDSIKDRF